MLKKIILFITLFVMFSSTKSFAYDLVLSDEGKTIRELKESIEGLDKVKSELYNKLNDFNPDQKLKTFFRDDLVLADLDNLRKIIEQYIKNNSLLEEELSEKSKKLLDVTDIRIKLLEEKKDLYKKMTPFIKSDSYQNYLDYIKSDTAIYSEKKEIDSSIYRKQEIINSKVTILEEKIKEHKTFLEDSLKTLVEGIMDEKINYLSNNKSFSELTNIEKTKILEKTTIKIQNNIDIMKNEALLDNSTIFIKVNNDKKIEIYNIVLKKLEDFKNSFK
ncbi:MAG: hypothetical protein PHH98_01740 [Candidatus Gracilibacteria bacterium]|nr:hypothetical protein [Candidatus Gracilibacteria bacterium]